MEWYIWVIFVAFILGLLLVDLLVIHRHAHEVRPREAAMWSTIWITLGVAFSLVIMLLYPDAEAGTAAGQYLTGYLIEKSLSVDNLFVFVLIFRYFRVPAIHQHRVLFYGIIGALVFRGIFIAAGAVLLARFAWIAYIFGAFLIFTAIRMATHDEMEVHPEDNVLLRLFSKVMKTTKNYEGQALLVRRDGHTWATPLLAVLVVVESTDVVFAVDSIPAIFAVTRDPFIVFTSNAFALLGLRALYFLLADAVSRFRFLQEALAIVLGLVGVKMILEELPDSLLTFHPPVWVPLVVIGAVIGGGILASMIWRAPPPDPTEPPEDPRGDVTESGPPDPRDDGESVDGDDIGGEPPIPIHSA